MNEQRVKASSNIDLTIKKEKCDDEELIDRIDWIKWFVINSYVKQLTSSNN